MPFVEVKREESKTEPKRKDVNVLLPCWALAYFPIMFLMGTLGSMGDPSAKFAIFLFSGVALLVLAPTNLASQVLISALNSSFFTAWRCVDSAFR